ncbi:hypothetical protein [Burkholderia sp. SIMBA_062]|uniref:hypothetical protein n=1 Tax=Burkholderia sp. SIMBA_062 TaxID=3085803 RepID=UPI00397E0C5E
MYRNRIVENLHENASSIAGNFCFGFGGELGFLLGKALLVAGMWVARLSICIARM